MKLKASNWWIIIAISGLLTLIGVLLICGARDPSDYFSQFKVERVDLAKLNAVIPDWSSYRQLSADLGRLEQNWVVAPAGDSSSFDSSSSSGPLERQIDGISGIYSKEINLKLNNLNRSLEEYSRSRQNQTRLAVQQKVAGLKEGLDKELQERARADAAQLSRFGFKVQSAHQLDLANLYLQLSLSKLSVNQSKDLETQAQIKTAIAKINQTIERKIQEERNRLEVELDRFTAKRQQEVLAEIKAYQLQLHEELVADIKQFREQSEAEFTQWRRQRERERERAIKSRKAELAPNP